MKTRTTNNSGIPFRIPFPSITQHEIEAGTCGTNNFDAFSTPFVSNGVCELCRLGTKWLSGAGERESHKPTLHIVEIDGEGIQRLGKGLRKWVIRRPKDAEAYKLSE